MELRPEDPGDGGNSPVARELPGMISEQELSSSEDGDHKDGKYALPPGITRNEAIAFTM